MTPKACLFPVVGIVMLACAPAHAADDTVAELMKKAEKSKLVLIGEMHGTREVPALVTDLAKRWTKDAAAQPLVVALEYPQTQAADLKAYVDSDGSAEARKRLLDTQFWSRAAQDGRSSHAMLSLIDALRMEARKGRKIALAAFDQNAGQENSDVPRDKSMADNLRAIVQANPSARVIALTGNYHARQADGANWDPKYRFMGGYLKDLAPYSVSVDALRGSYWGCSSGAAADCKVEKFGNDPVKTQAPGLYVDKALMKNGYALGLMLEQFSVSLPASRTE
jgi:hypothetical protein